jgi:hypothetical protein
MPGQEKKKNLARSITFSQYPMTVRTSSQILYWEVAPPVRDTVYLDPGARNHAAYRVMEKGSNLGRPTNQKM